MRPSQIHKYFNKLFPGLLGFIVAGAWIADPAPTAADARFRATFQLRAEAATTVALVATAEGLTIDGTLTPWPISDATSARFEDVEVAPGKHVAIARAFGPDGHSAAMLVGVVAGRPSTLWSARLDWHGDPGERVAAVLETSDRTGDGVADVVVAQRSETTHLCGQADTLLFPRALAPASMTLTPVVISRFPTAAAVENVTAMTSSPGPLGAPRVPALRFVGASSRAGAPEDARAVPAPRELAGSDGRSFWAEGRGGVGRGEFVVAQWDTTLPIRAFAITPVPTGAPADFVPASRVWIQLDGGERLSVTLPTTTRPGQRVWVVPRAPRTTRCLTIGIDDASVRRGVAEAAARVGLARVEAYSPLDFGEGIDVLVGRLDGRGDEGDDAVDLLAQVGAPAVEPLLAHLEAGGPVGRRRTLRALVRIAPADARVHGALVTESSSGTDDAAREEALSALARVSPDALGRVVDARSAGRERAMALIGAHPTELGFAALLRLLAEEDSGATAAARTALAEAFAQDPLRGQGWLASWRAEATPAAVANVAQALGTIELPASTVRDWLDAWVDDAAPRATDFAARYRFVKAAARRGGAATVAWLVGLSRDAEEWMLRDAALEALAARHAPEARAAARAALRDPYPRVRERAVGLTQDEASIVSLALRDPFPRVRVAALETLSNKPVNRETAAAALRDTAMVVRAAAIRALDRFGAVEHWPAVAARLEDDREWPLVIAAGLELARHHCLAGATSAIVATMRRGLREGAWAPDVELAVAALETARSIGGETAEEAMRVARRASSPEALRAAAARPAPQSCSAPRS